MFYRMTVAIIITFLLSFVAGWYFLSSSWDGRTSINVTQLKERTLSRDPAAIRKVFDFSNLRGGALKSASKRRLLLGSKVIHEEARVGLQFGHFVVQGAGGERVFACSRYSKIELSFEAEGFAVSGERPKMIVEGDCRVSGNINQIEPIWLPIEKIMEEEPGEMELEFMHGDRVAIKFEHLIDNWPKSWELKEIKLINPDSIHGDSVLVSGDDIRRYTGEPFSMRWQ